MKAHHIATISVLCLLGFLICWQPNRQIEQSDIQPAATVELETEQTLLAPERPKIARQEILLNDVLEEPEETLGWLFESSKPYSLFQEDTFAGNLPTADNFAKFCEQQELQQTQESFVKFERILEIDAFQSFILGYRLREIERRRAYEGSRTLTQELDAIIGYIHNLVIDEIEFWSAVDDYENEIVEDTHREDHLVIGMSVNENRIMALLTQKKRKILDL